MIGFTIPVHKDINWTSFDVVKKLRNVTRIKKVGHAGTLDPFATGVLVLGFGKHTKQLDQIKSMKKRYQVTVHLGIETDTYDPSGEIVARCECEPFSDREIEAALQKFIGRIDQMPPIYSARKVKGKALYTYARAGKYVERESRLVDVFDIKILGYQYPELELAVTCGPGTYIRSIAHDLGKDLKCGAHASQLCRTAVGDYELRDAWTIKEFVEAWKSSAA